MNIERLRLNLTYEKKLLRSCRNSIKGLPKGGLTCYSRNDCVYYKKNFSGTQKYIGTADQAEVQKLKKRHLLNNMIGILEKNTELMESLVNGYQEYNPLVLQNSFSKAYQDINYDMISELGLVLEPAVNSFKEDEKYYTTSSGLRVRSRVEAIIADLYTQKNIPFQYEQRLYFDDGSMIHPDFTVFKPSEKRFLYHEHVGLLSDPEYLKNYLWKFEHYIANGYYPYHDVLFTYEKPDAGIDINEISMLIDMFMR